ncbi:MAG TPA: hypothetical protein PL124_04405 [Candidatus Cloacimonadota bacterium]|nr:hypothetical protein [Candidatus Cloacimonadota bacterium]HPS38635.1 hypothetical protein [Candidatus Cloacimonadota bacterium]
MKSLYLSLIFGVIVLSLAGQGLSKPESVTYDYATGIYYVSNTGDGSIVQSTDLVNYSFFAQDLGSVRGLYISGKYLYAASNLGLVLFNLSKGERIKTIGVPGSIFLNDVTGDNSGNIYVTDNKANRIFKYESGSGKISTFIKSGIQNPNGIVYDKRYDRLLLVSLKANSPVQTISLPDGVVGTYKSTPHSSLDGLALKPNGVIYYSSWGTGSIHKLRNNKDAPEVLVKGLSGPADFFLQENTVTDSQGNKIKKYKLIIPQMTSNSIKIKDLN